LFTRGSISLCPESSGRAPATVNHTDHNHHRRHNEGQMNQTSSPMQADAQKPETYNRSTAPIVQSLSISSVQPCRASFRSGGIPRSGFPHSKQNRLARGVINPQNGHILCEPICCAWGASVARTFPNKSAMEASRLRSRLRNEPLRNEPWMGSIDLPSLHLSPRPRDGLIGGSNGRSDRAPMYHISDN
jgi:hypothetical protein